MVSRFENFKNYFEKNNPRWRVFYKEELPENIEHKTVYFIITGDTLIKKEKIINLSIYYVASRVKDGLIDFRKTIQDFINIDLANEFASSDFFNVDGYDINYSIDDDRKTLRIAEINCSFNYTRLREQKNRMIMKTLADNINMT